MFSPGMLTPQAASLLTEMAREWKQYGFRLSVSQWPLWIARPGRLQGQIIGIDPAAFRADSGSGSDSGSGGECCDEFDTPVVADLCLIRNPKTGAVMGIRYVRHDLGSKDEECITAPDCPTEEGCDDSESGSGSGSGFCEPLCWSDMVGGIVSGTNTTLSGTSGVWTTLTDLDFTVTSDGVYQLIGSAMGVVAATNAGAYIEVRLRLNGGAFAGGAWPGMYAPSGSTLSQEGVTRVHRAALVAGDVITAEGRIVYTGALLNNDVQSSQLYWQRVA